MRFLLDAHVPHSVAEFLRHQHCDVFLVNQRLLPGTPDPVIVADANQLNAIVVTQNRKHFRPLITRDDAKRATEYPNAGLLTYECRIDMLVPMLEEHWDLIALAHSKRQSQADKRLIVEILHGRITFR